MLSFTKMNGAGNDFVMIDNRDGAFVLKAEHIARLCDRHRGIGADGLIAAEPSADARAHLRMRYFNADGGEAEMCGNGARCFARFGAKLLGLPESIAFETLAGTLTAHLDGDRVQLAMSTPHGEALGTSLQAAGEALTVHFLNTGVPHAVVFVQDLAATHVRSLGAALRFHEHFAPKGTNANFAAVLPDGSLELRTYERGVEDETLACGTGVVAAALLHHLLQHAPSPILVKVRGGDTLSVAFVREAGTFAHVTLTGPADFVFAGTTSL
ncbi:MAG: diaminopimelate epimerase [Chthoniobacterales bacterium]|nr:diaminopimelate epimerase [Chthoniobacterales bacterium]